MDQPIVGASLTGLWAKTNPATGQWHPLLCHLIETSAVAAILWDEILAPSTRRVIADAMGLPSNEARQWSLFLVGAHDLGKASPSFQSKWSPSVLPLQQLRYRFPSDVTSVPHGRISSIELAKILAKRGVERRVAQELARAVGGHHGIFDTPSVLMQSSPQAVGEGLWVESRTWIIDWLARQHSLSGLPTRCDLAGLTLLAGLTTVSDWIASSEEHFPYRTESLGQTENLDALLSESEMKAAVALDRLGWRTRLRFPEPLDFQKFFEISNPRPLQIESICLSEDLALPSLVIVEAPMGEGKTEAALFVAERLKQRHELRGSFIALPTQATSNQMFGRVVKALSHGASEGIAHILLLHGHASLSAEFNDLKSIGETGFVPSSVEPDGATETQVMAAEWFTHKKRGLLAPYGVGTVDQVLLAALQSKHVFVRLFGLAGKVVVIDEVHAYDTYMSALLERLLEWLRAIGTSVVMLSATLPSSRRASLVKAFAPEYEGTSEIPPYPCLTVVSGGELRTTAFVAATPGKRVRLETAPSDPTDLALWLRDRVHAGGGCAAIVCNTVSRAQEIYEACRRLIPEDAEDGYPLVDLLHSRFPFEEREVREQRTLKRFGKPGDSPRPAAAILVATQIIEQSLDIDFDLMVSELPPIDLLFQRAGRLHRHQRERRPTGPIAILGLIETPISAGAPDFPGGNTKVYEEHILLRTWLVLRGRLELSIPEDIRPDVEAVYADPGDVPEEPALLSLWKTTASKLLASRTKDQGEAAVRYLPRPVKGIGLDALTSMGRDDDDKLHPFFQALTRLTEPTVTVVCLFARADDLFLDRECLRPLSLGEPVTMASAADLLRRSCSLSHRRVVYLLEAIPIPSTWKKNALLRNCRPLIFDTDNCYRVGNHQIRLCPDTGLRVEESPSANV